jgi:hypothetical protein
MAVMLVFGIADIVIGLVNPVKLHYNTLATKGTVVDEDAFGFSHSSADIPELPGIAQRKFKKRA